MNVKDFEKVTNSIKEKLGDEYTSIIADDLVTLITDNNSMNETIKQKNDEIIGLNSEKEMLMKTNMNLLQQVGFNETETESIDNKDIIKEFDFSSAFDERGNFKR